MRGKSMLAERIAENNNVVPNILAAALRQFSEASVKLEERYELLRREAESLRAQLREKDLTIKKAEKLATLGEAAAAIAHEVRNPLGAMKLFVSLLNEDCAGKPPALELIDQINRSINSLDAVVGNILQFSKQKKLSLGPVNLVALIREQLALVIAQSAGGAKSEVRLCETHFIQGNEHALRQVFHNLFLNALQATKQRGTISVQGRPLPEQGIEITVKDDGPGIDAGVIERLFEPFVTTRSEGTGLGLAIVRQILEQHGARISVRNCGGAEFTIVFPAAAGNVSK